MLAAWLPLGVNGAPQRVASLNLCTDAMLFELVDDARIASVTALSRDPSISYYHERAAGLPVNRGHAEDLLSVDADLVITGPNTSVFLLRMLSRLGLEVVRFEHANDLASYQRDLLALGRLLERETRARELIGAMSRRLATPFTRARPPPRAVVFQPNGWVAGDHSLIAEVLAHAGLDRPAALGGGRRVSLEELVRSQPDIVITERRHQQHPSVAEALAEHPALVRLAAAPGGAHQRLAVEERLWTCAGQHTLQAVEMLRRDAHGT